jgi:hypothetical protein
MKRNRIAVLAGSLVLGALASGCAHGNGSSASKSVRVVTNSQDVQGCEKLSLVRLSGTWTSGAGREELENLVRAKGGNVLLLSGGAGSHDSGVAYRCSGGTGAGSP